MHTFLGRVRSGRIVAVFLALAGLGLTVKAPQTSNAAVSPPAPTIGADLYQLDTMREQYTQQANNLRQLQLYSAPVGLPNELGWRFRDPSLTVSPGAPQGRPALLPFGLRLAPTTHDAALASLTNEDGVGLSLTLTPVTANTPAIVAGQASTDTTIYPGAAPGGGDVALHPTVSGVDVRLTLHQPSQGDTFALSLTPDAGVQVTQQPDGTIVATRAITEYGDDGTPYVVQQPEYVVARPVLRDSSTDPAAPATTGPVTITLSSTLSGPQQLTVTMDPTWLHDSARAFPVRLDLPVATVPSIGNTGKFGTVSSCAPDVLAHLTDVVVGTEGSCTYHGIAYFDVSPLHPGTAIQSATLNLYTPQQTGATNVLVSPNAPAPQTLVWQTPSWNTAPSLQSSAGRGQSASNGHWQSWDVTDLVRQWVQNRDMNSGVTLTSAAAPVLFASPLGTGDATPDSAPRLTIVYAQAGSASASTVTTRGRQLASLSRRRLAAIDGASTIYGISGAIVPNNNFSGGCASTVCNAAISTYGAAHSLQASYVRFSRQIGCSVALDWTPQYNLIKSAFQDGLIPIMQFVQNDSCASSDGNWASQLNNFISSMPTGSGLIYFEIANEEDIHLNVFGSNYPVDFAHSAATLNNAASGIGTKGYTYRILPGGVTSPLATQNVGCGTASYTLVQNAINTAEAAPYSVPAGVLGVAVHPYSYNTNEIPMYWRNYYTTYNFDNNGNRTNQNGYAGSCGDLGAMLNTWLSTSAFSGMPLVFTETNWKTNVIYNSQSDGWTNIGAYVVDLFTWLSRKGYAAPSSSNVRVAVFQPADAGATYLGIYQGGAGAEKRATLPSCPYNGNINNVSQTLSYDFSALTHNLTCY